MSSWVARSQPSGIPSEAMSFTRLLEMRRQQLTDGQVLGAQDMAEVAKTTSGGKRQQVGGIAQVNGVQAEGRAGRDAVENRVALAVANREDAHL